MSELLGVTMCPGKVGAGICICVFLQALLPVDCALLKNSVCM